MENYTFFTTPEGSMYGVSQRVMNSGYTPKKGVRLSTPAEITAFIERALSTPEAGRMSLEDKKILAHNLKKTGLAPEAIKALIGVTLEEDFEPSDEEKQAVKEKIDAETKRFKEEFAEAVSRAEYQEEIKDLTPIQKRRLEREQKKLDQIEAEYRAKIAEEVEKNKIFDTLTDEQLSLVEVLEEQGLSQPQIREILKTRAEKTKERDEMVKYLARPKE